VLASSPGRSQRSAVFGAWDAWNYASTEDFLGAVVDAPAGEPQDRWLAMIAHLHVMAAPPEHVLAMKAMAARRFRDTDDITILCRLLDITTIEAVEAVVNTVFPAQPLNDRQRATIAEALTQL
jgi:hypothetical protein